MGIQHGRELPAEPAGMSPEASLIAISEITGIPAERFCNWVIVGWSHADDGHAHQMSLISPCMTTGRSEYRAMALLLERALADARHLARQAGQ